MTSENRSGAATEKKNHIGEETILKVAKEVAIKFIEMGRVTPSTFDEAFKNIHATIKNTVDKG